MGYTTTTSAFDFNKPDKSKQIFMYKEDGYHLMRDGKVLDTPVWYEKPFVYSYLFLVEASDTGHNLYTIAGDPVRNAQGIWIKTILHFWIIYQQDVQGKLCIGKLEVEGNGFALNPLGVIDGYGSLQPNQITILTKGKWETYIYTGKLTYTGTDDSLRLPSFTQNQKEMLEAGFGYDFIRDCCKTQGVQCTVSLEDEIAAYQKIHILELQIFKQIFRVLQKYSAEVICDSLGLSQAMMYTIMYYKDLKDIEEL